MKLSNFRDYDMQRETFCAGIEFATVDVTTGLFLKRTVSKRIVKEFANWFFMDGGEFTPAHQAEALARAFKAQEAQDNG